MIHLYWGDGKGKTTAAMGLAVRALGQGKKVTIVQFCKNGTSGELEPLRRLGAVIYSGQPETRLVSRMTEEEKRSVRILQNAQLTEALANPPELLILDEACAAIQYQLIARSLIEQALSLKNCEVVLTGRNPSGWLVEKADYNTEMHLHAHPYQHGIPARKGVEY